MKFTVYRERERERERELGFGGKGKERRREMGLSKWWNGKERSVEERERDKEERDLTVSETVFLHCVLFYFIFLII